MTRNNVCSISHPENLLSWMAAVLTIRAMSNGRAIA
jgi:hypothetical protein